MSVCVSSREILYFRESSTYVEVRTPKWVISLKPGDLTVISLRESYNNKKRKSNLKFLSFIYTLLVTSDVKCVPNFEEFIDFVFLFRHVECNTYSLVKNEADSKSKLIS